ncbi:MAG: DUF554 domain-containing protein [Oscillospiraceae bacterium]|nr:DUF554 domain-containing protein [Oscillospiraceae bacterium]
MRVTGALINAIAILLGGGLGVLLMGRISEKFAKSALKAIGLCICIIGIKGALEGDIMLVVVSMAIGTFLGEWIGIEDGLNRVGEWAQNKLSKDGQKSSFSEGFVTASLLFCIGAMAVIGSIDSGLRDDQTIIFTKSVLDGVISLLLASTLGFGVLFSAISVFLYQGSIEIFAGFLQNVFTDSLITQISAMGGVMIFGIGVNLVVDAKIKIGNLLPALLVAVGYYFLILS